MWYYKCNECGDNFRSYGRVAVCNMCGEQNCLKLIEDVKERESMDFYYDTIDKLRKLSGEK